MSSFSKQTVKRLICRRGVLPARRLGVFSLAIALTFVVVACGEKPIESGRRFVTTVPDDSLVESFTRTKHHLRGVINSRSDSIVYDAQLGDSGLVQAVDIATYSRRPPKAVDPKHIALAKGTLPWIMGSGALLEQILRRVRVLGQDSVDVQVIYVALPSRSRDLFKVTGNGPDSLVLTGIWGGRSQDILRVAIDSGFRVTGMTLARARAVMESAD